jgi:hypothetical protein
MCKALDKAMEIGDIVLVKKTGGKSGDFFRAGSARGAQGKMNSRSRGK